MPQPRKTLKDLISFVESYANPIMKRRRLISKGWIVRFGNSRINYGLCDSTKKVITISKYFLLRSSEKEIIDTVRHEIAHALVGSEHQHGKVWRRKYIELGGRKINYTPRTTISSMRYKWVGTCYRGHKHYMSASPRKVSYCHECSPRDINNSIILWKNIKTNNSSSISEEFKKDLRKLTEIHTNKHLNHVAKKVSLF